MTKEEQAAEVAAALERGYPLRFCRDCAHYDAARGHYDDHRCAYLRKPVVKLTTGKKILEGPHVTCDAMRCPGHLAISPYGGQPTCGPEGRYWKQRPPKWWQIWK